MSGNSLSSFYNVGYCKYKDRCSNGHAKGDCEDSKCKKLNCQKKHRKFCNNGTEYRFHIKNKYEFKHGLESQKRNIENIQFEASQLET